MPDPVYGDAEGFAAYWQQRGVDVSVFDTNAVDAALLVAAVWLDGAYLKRFGGWKTGNRDQVREWPRVGVQDVYGYAIPSDVPPRELINAAYEAAYRQLQTPGVFFKDYTPSKYKQAAVSGAVSVTYNDGSAYDFQTQFPAIDAALAPILSRAMNVASLSGAVCR
jgi:hypothetical protein